jgi:hypothetical protein
LLPFFFCFVPQNTNNVPQPHDNGHLLSGWDFNGATLGYAGVGVMCVSPTQSGGIDQTYDGSDLLNGAVLAHELGLSFFFRLSLSLLWQMVNVFAQATTLVCHTTVKATPALNRASL